MKNTSLTKSTSEQPSQSFPYQITLNIEKYELETVLETSAAFLSISVKAGNKKIEGIERANIIKKVAKFKNETFKLDLNFIESAPNSNLDSSNPGTFKEKKAEFIIRFALSSSKSSKVDSLATITIPFDLSSYLNEQILGKDEVLQVKNSKFNGFLFFNITFTSKFAVLGLKSDLSSPSSTDITSQLKRSKSIVSNTEETKEISSQTSIELPKNAGRLSEKPPKTVLRKMTAPAKSQPRIIIKGPALENSVQRYIMKSPDEFEQKLNNLLGKGLQTKEETDFLNRKLEVMALKEENLDLRHENEVLKDEKKHLLKALAELNEEKQTWFKCFQSQPQTQKTHNPPANSEKKSDESQKLILELLEKLKVFEEKLTAQEEKSKQEMIRLRDENAVLRNEKSALQEKMKAQNEEIFNLKAENSKMMNEISEMRLKSEKLEDKYRSANEDLAQIVNVILTNGSAEIMDLIEPYLKSSV